MSFGEQYLRAQLDRCRPRETAFWLANYMPQKAVLDAPLACGWDAPQQIIANACASGANAIGHAFRVVRAGKYERVLCGGYDALSELVFVGFDSLQASTPEKIRPFDKNRSGLVLGEGAALLALEDFASARRRGAPMLAEITGYGISTDNHHLTQPHPSWRGPRQAMKRALADAGRTPGDVDYINAHGTATTFNDATEGAAIAQLFGARVPVSSTKSMMGHALGGAGAIEAAFSILALRGQFLPPNINYVEADPAFTLNIVANTAREAALKLCGFEFIRFWRHQCEPRDRGASRIMSVANRRNGLGHAAWCRTRGSVGANMRRRSAANEMADESGIRAGASILRNATRRRGAPRAQPATAAGECDQSPRRGSRPRSAGARRA
jgi:3-oxoacyl-[acyl-carrier-protein] synthase II